MAEEARLELARLHLQAHKEWVQAPPEDTVDLSYHEVMADAILANPDVILRALPPDAVMTWLDTQDGYGFIIEAIRAGAAEPI